MHEDAVDRLVHPARPTPDRARGWTLGDLERLERVTAAFAGGDATRRAALIADALARVADPLDQRLLRLALRAFDWRLVNWLLGHGAIRFRDLDERGQDAYLMGWATSRSGRRRTVFQVLKRLSLFFAYADPGPESDGNPSWGPLGYRPPIDPVLPPSPAVEPLALGQAEPDHDTRETVLEADVVVVGSGAGGGVVARDLAALGRAVVVVEAGPYVPESEMPLSEIDGLERMYLDHGLLASDDAGVVLFSGSVLGGGTTVNWTSCFEPPGWLRSEWTGRYGVDGFDGAETDADLAALRQELAFAAPPMIPPKDDVILRGAGELGWEASPMERDAVGCGDCGSCGFGCRRGAKRSGPRLHLAQAARRGARIVVDAPVERVVVRGGRAVAVEARIGDGRRLTVQARSVVVAAGALRSPALLQRSGLTHPAIGRNLRVHPVPVVVGRYGQPIEMWRGTTQGARSLRFLGPGATGGSPGGFIIESAPAHVGVAASLFPWEGRVASETLLGELRYLAPLIAICRDLDGGTVSVRRSGGVHIRYRLSERDGATVRAAAVAMAQLHRAANALEVVVLATPAPRSYAGDHIEGFLRRLATLDISPNRLLLASAHQMGTVRMGADPGEHACDPRGHLRADRRGRIIEGLYVADGSLFPSASGVNPMVTIMALARRVGRTVAAEL